MQKAGESDPDRVRYERLFACLVVGVFAFHWCTEALAGETPAPVTIRFPWTHQAQFGGFYVAEKRGLYAAEGLTVRYLEGGLGADVLQPVLDGRAQFGIADATALVVAREQGKPVRAISVIYRRNPTIYVVKADSGITKPEHFVGKTIRLSGVVDESFAALMRHAGIGPEQYRTVILPSELARFTSGEADVWQVYINAFAVNLEQAGLKLRYIYPDDFGVHFYGDTLFTTDDVVASKHDLVLRFLRASLKGWAIAVQDPRLVGSMVAEYKPGADAPIETLKMRASQPLVNTGRNEIGWMREDRWAGMIEELVAGGTISGAVMPKDVFTLEFLNTIYGRGR